MSGQPGSVQSLQSKERETDWSRWETLPDQGTIAKTLDAVKNRGIIAEQVSTPQEALERITKIIPEGAELMTGASKTLEEIGFTQLLKTGSHGWKNLRDRIVAEKDPVRQAEMRRQSVTVDYFLGSVHAISENGELIVASASGSQIPSYAYTSKNVIWVAGAQKIVRSLEDGLKRVREYSLARESERMRGLGFPGSVITKILIIEREPAQMKRQLNLILVNQKLGF